MAGEVILVRGWTTGYSRELDGAVIRFEIGAAEPAVFALPIAEAQAMARAILDLDTPGRSTPRRPN
jgi:hypothetical protein